MAWLFDYLKIVKIRGFCLDYSCTTCGAYKYSAGLVFLAHKFKKKTMPKRVEFSGMEPIKPTFRDLELNSQKECYEEICYQLSILKKNQITKIKNDYHHYCPIKFIFHIASNDNFKNILLEKITYTPIHEFYEEYQEEILQKRIRIESEQAARALKESQAKAHKAEDKILNAKLHLKKIEYQKLRSKKFNDFISQLQKSEIKERFYNIINNNPFGISAIPKEFFEICNSDKFIKVFKLLDQNTKDKFKKFLANRKEKHFKKIVKFIANF